MQATGIATVEGGTGPDDRPGPGRPAGHHLFTAVGADQARRRPADAAVLVAGAVGLVVATALARSPAVDETDLAEALDHLLGWLGPLWQAIDVAALVAVVGLVVTAAVGRRASLLRDQLLALATATLGTVVLSRSATGDWPDLSGLLGSGDGVHHPARHLVALTTVVAASRPQLTRPGRRLGTWLVAGSAVAALGLGDALPSGVLGAVALGVFAAALVHVAFGSPAGLPDPRLLVADLAEVGVPVARLDPVGHPPPGAVRYRATDATGRPLDVRVWGRDARDASLAARFWRFLWYRDPGPQLAWSTLQQVEHEALVGVFAARAGVAVPDLVTAFRGRAGDAILVTAPPPAPRLDDLPADAVDDVLLAATWGEVARLRRAGIAHGRLDATAFLVTERGPVLVELGSARVAASAPALDTDVASLLVSTTSRLGIDRAVGAAIDGVGPEAVAAALPFTQPAALSPSLRDVARARHVDVGALRKAAATATGVELPESAKLRRVSLRDLCLVTLTLVAAWVLLSQLADVGLARLVDELSTASWGWVVTALVIAQLTLVSQAVSLHGAVLRPLPGGPTVALESAIKFVNLTVPSSAGRIAINIRFLQRLGVPMAVAAAAGAVDGLAGTLVEVVLVVATLPFVDLGLDPSGGDGDGNLLWVGLAALAATVGVAVVAIAVPKLRAKVLPVARQAGAALSGIARSPRQLGLLLGGNLATEVLFALALGASVRAYGAEASLAELLLVNMGVSVFASIMPVPGGIGVAEAGLTAGLVAVGVPPDTALAAAITHRLVTYYLPPIWGYASFRWLGRHGYI